MKIRIFQIRRNILSIIAAVACVTLASAFTASAVSLEPPGASPAVSSPLGASSVAANNRSGVSPAPGSGPLSPLSPPASSIYADSTPVTGRETPMFNGGSLTMLTCQNQAQMLSIILQSREGGLVVIDGGWEADTDHLLQAVRDRGGHVNAWLITHPDSDHAGALYNILARSETGIVIDHVYARMTDISWYYQEDGEAAPFVDEFRQRLARLPEGSVTDNVAVNAQISVPGIEIKVINDALFTPDDPVNNSSVVYRVDMNGVRMMFLGDLAWYGGCHLLETVPQEELHADIVQMAHHGQRGVGEEVYKAIGASICLWPTPQWLWDNDSGAGFGSGDWNTLETRTWIRNMGVTRNYVMKDGDITLR